MSKAKLVEMLKNLCQYNTVEIKHTFSINDQPVLVVKCVKNTSIIEIDYLETSTTELFDNHEKAAETIELVINLNVKVKTS